MLMSALSPKARALIEDAHEEIRPPTGERERLAAMLDARLGVTVPSAVQPAPPPVPRASGWRLMTSLGVGAALVGGVALWAFQPQTTHDSVAPPPSASAVVPPPVAEAAPSAPAPEAQISLAPEPVRSAKPAVETPAPAQPVQDRLAQEVALLSRATSELRAGRSGAALKLLDEHQRKFSNGALALERRAVRAQALCTLKRVNEGRAELSQLPPQSPAAGRAKQLCDAAASGLQKR